MLFLHIGNKTKSADKDNSFSANCSQSQTSFEHAGEKKHSCPYTLARFFKALYNVLLTHPCTRTLIRHFTLYTAWPSTFSFDYSLCLPSHCFNELMYSCIHFSPRSCVVDKRVTYTLLPYIHKILNGVKVWILWRSIHV